MIDVRPASRIRDDLDHRIELVSMDRYCADITVALYLLADGRTAVVHSYAGHPDVADRLAWLAGAMRVLGGMRGTERAVDFACGTWHDRAARRVFLEACKLDPGLPVASRPFAVDDTRTNQAITVASLDQGAYRVTAVATDPTAASRAPAVAAGLAKLADLETDPDDDAIVRFPCGAQHDELIGVLLPRAINVRAALREQELAASRGILVAPSAQEAAGA
jgi:hypothetical protein